MKSLNFNLITRKYAIINVDVFGGGGVKILEILVSSDNYD